MNNLFFLGLLGSNKNEKNHSKVLLIISFVIGILGLVIIMRLIEISFPKEISNKSKVVLKQTIKEKNRGFLLDRNNRILASNIYIYNLKAYPKKIKDPESAINLVGNEIDLHDRTNLIKKLSNKSKYEVLVKKNITAPQKK